MEGYKSEIHITKEVINLSKLGEIFAKEFLKEKNDILFQKFEDEEEGV